MEITSRVLSVFLQMMRRINLNVKEELENTICHAIKMHDASSVATESHLTRKKVQVIISNA